MTVVVGKHPCVALVTLWTKKEAILDYLSVDDFAFLGQLYSKEIGINQLIRSLLAHKNIRHLFIIGNDLSNSGEALLVFFQKGVDSSHKVVGLSNVAIDEEIPLSALEDLRKNVFIYDYRILKDFSQLRQIIAGLSLLPSYGANETFPEKKIIAPDTFSSEQSGFVVRHAHVCDAWLQILFYIMRFGTVKKSEYGIEQRELLNLISVIEQENPDAPLMKDYFSFSRKDLEEYYPYIISGAAIEGVEYSYGQRLRAPVDQIQQIITALRKTPYTRRAIAITWDVQKDIFSEKPPCLILTEFTIQEDKLYLTAFFRSNDMFHAWPRNAFGLRKLQFFVSEQLGITPASLTIISQSAHIYKDSWLFAEKVLREQTLSEKIHDSRGNFVITVHNNLIHVIHTTPIGKQMQEFSGTNIHELYMKLAPYISEISHALYLGTELQKAALALQNNLPYIQDKDLLMTSS